MQEFRPQVVVWDALTVSAGLAADSMGVLGATLIPHHYPLNEPGAPPFMLGLLPARTALGRGGWRAWWPLVMRTRRRIRQALNEVRAELELPPVNHLDWATSQQLALVATFPQLEYPRRWARHVHVTGPMLFELPGGEVALPEGDTPLVYVAASTTLDRGLQLLRVTLEALEKEPVRVVATTGKAGQAWDEAVPKNAVVVDWVSHRQVMPQASLVVCVGGHGTVARALTWGIPVLVCPGAPEMAENGARVAWAGAGLMLPRRLLGPGPLRWAVRRLLAYSRFAAQARELAAWGRSNDGAATGADLVQRYARQ
jgi:UDP:flavonoid glycosyltransferase YjiC (YdhE family)